MLYTGSWDETKRKISDELCVASSKGGMVVQYLDDEDDWITVAITSCTHTLYTDPHRLPLIVNGKKHLKLDLTRIIATTQL